MASLWAGLLAVAPALAQSPNTTPPPTAANREAKRLHALRITGASPRIDGRLDDDVWVTAPAMDDFVQGEPDNMRDPTEHTRIQVAFDNRYVYVAARCDTRDPAQIRTGLGRRDNYPPSDVISVGFDPRDDHLTAYVFKANASGVQSDATFFDDTRSDSDYDGVWEVRTQTTSSGWTAEFRIPFSQMRFSVPGGGSEVWGFQVRRDIQGRGEYDEWAPTPRGEQGVVSRYGELIFDGAVTPPRRLELLPYTLGQFQAKSGSPSSKTLSAGLDLRMGIGTSTTLSATVNPDFGQVEADPAVLNLSVFETFFAEKRPFFLEDSRTFVLPYNQFPDFYSRRIGRAPGRFALQSNETLVSKPDYTTILGAAKLTGKASGWTYGALSALTSREYAIVDRTTTNPDGSVVTARDPDRLMEPMTSYNVGRVQRDILHGTSNVGAIVTAVVREKDADAFTGGGDFNLRWDQNRYVWNGHFVGTHAPISGVVHSGFGGATNLSYTGKYLSANGHFDHFSPTFRNADLGFLSSRTNKNELNDSINLGQPDPRGPFRQVIGGIYSGRQWTDEGLVFGEWLGTNMNATLKNFWTAYVGVQRNFARLDDLDTRGGPPIVTPADTGFNFGFGTDSRKRWGLSLDTKSGRSAVHGWNVTTGPNLRLQPSARVQASLGITYTAAHDDAQWIENIDRDDTTTDNIYGTLDRHVLNITGRTTYAFSRDLTLETYLQPFVAVGRYSNIRKLARPSSYDFQPAAPSTDPDFNRKSLRGTIVLRWEYVRGSTLFFVWNLATSDETTRLGSFSPLHDLGRAFSAPGTNSVAIKINHWFTP